MRSLSWRGAAFAAAVSIAFAATAMAADETTKAEKKVVKKPPSICVGLDLNACGTKAECFGSSRSPPRPARCARRTAA